MDQVAQGLHIALGALFVLIPVAKHWTQSPPLWGSAAGLVFGAVKEGWYDVHFEDAATRGSGWRDFIHYVYGIALANLLLIL